MLKGILPIAILAIAALIISACSDGGGNLVSDVNGKYQTEPGNGMVDINLANDSASLTIDGHLFKGVVEKIDKGKNTVLVKMNTDAGKSEVWSIHQVWNDNGSAFKLKLRRNGTTDTLVPVGRS